MTSDTALAFLKTVNQLRADGHKSYDKIAQALNDTGTQTPSGEPAWTRQLLAAEIYRCRGMLP
jgi:hypothetical protein